MTLHEVFGREPARAVVVAEVSLAGPTRAPSDTLRE